MMPSITGVAASWKNNCQDTEESSKIKKLRLEDSHNILEFGNDKTQIVNWNIVGNHIDGKSDFSYFLVLTGF